MENQNMHITRFGVHGRSVAALLAMAIPLLGACSLIFPTKPESPALGSIRVAMTDVLSSPSAARTIAPASVAATSCLLTADGPDSQHLSVTSTTPTTHTFTDIAVGSWTINAVGKIGSTTVSMGTLTVIVLKGQTISGTIVMEPAPGTGSWSFALTWTGIDGMSVGIPTLIHSGGAAASPAPTVSPGTQSVTLSGSGLLVGMYDLTLPLTRDATTITIFEHLQIINGQSSTTASARSLTTSDFTFPPTAPTGLVATTSNRTIVLTWTDTSSTETAFVVERRTDGGAWIAISESVPANATSYTDSTAGSASIYSYRVMASFPYAFSLPSNEATPNLVRVDSVSAGADFSLYTGGSSTMSAMTVPVSPFDSRVAWSSSDPTVATIDSLTGLVSALKAGTTTLTATSMDGAKTDSCLLTVFASTATISAFGFQVADNPSLGGSYDATIAGTAISVTFPYGTAVTALKATFTHSGSSIRVGAMDQTSHSTANDFSSPLTYHVASVGAVPYAYTIDYIVTVRVAPAVGVSLSERSIPGSMSDQEWIDVASSADGSRLVAVPSTGYLYTSSDGGATWTQRLSDKVRSWRAVASSSDGTALAAIADYYFIMTSNDAGNTWTLHSFVEYVSWNNLTMSADGTRLAATIDGGYIYTSSDSGVTWTKRTSPGTESWLSIAGSADGSRLAMTQNTGTSCVKYSLDSGLTWSVLPGSSNLSINWIAMAGDGLTIFGGYYLVYSSSYSGSAWGSMTEFFRSGSLYFNGLASSFNGKKVAFTNNNYGGIWIGEYSSSWAIAERTSAGSRTWTGLCSSTDGTRIAATSANGYVYTSSDGGGTWTERGAAGNRNWAGIACSSDGTRLAAIAAGYGIYLSSDSGESWVQRNLDTSAYSATSWKGIAMSPDGSMIWVGGASSKYIRYSLDYGATWSWSSTTLHSSSYDVQRIACSAVFTNPDTTKYCKLMAIVLYNSNYGYIYRSVDSGATWTNTNYIYSSNSSTRFDIAMSSDGERIVALGDNTAISLSTNAGSTWSTLESLRKWKAVAMSSDGARIAAVTEPSSSTCGFLYLSTDSGATWSENSASESRYWSKVDLPANGSKLILLANYEASAFISGSDFFDLPITVE